MEVKSFQCLPFIICLLQLPMFLSIIFLLNQKSKIKWCKGRQEMLIKWGFREIVVFWCVQNTLNKILFSNPWWKETLYLLLSTYHTSYLYVSRRSCTQHTITAAKQRNKQNLQRQHLTKVDMCTSGAVTTANANMAKLLQDNENKLSSLCTTDLKELSRKMYQNIILTDSMDYDLLKSLDHSRVEPQLQVRYLLRLVSVRVREDEGVWEKFMTLLASMGERQMYDYLSELTSDIDIWYDCRSEFSSIPNTEEWPIEVSCLDAPLCSEDIHWILEVLVNASHKWEHIAVALKFDTYERANFNKGDVKLSLNSVLSCWLARDTSTPPGVTIITLLKALRSEFVGEGRVAQELEDKYKHNKQSSCTLEIEATDSIFSLTSQSYDVEVADGKSTLLQVQASPGESVCYQWKKDGQPLANSSTYCGVHEDVLVVSHASQGTEGEYTYCVSCRGSEKCSNKINLTVLYPPAKKRLLDLYSIHREVPQDSWPPVRTKSFINLTVVQSDSEHVGKTVSAIGGKSDKVIDKRVKVNYTVLFGEYISQTLMVAEGLPGSGKTTLVHKIVKDWSKGIALKNAKLVFIVTLRIINRKTAQETLSSILRSFYRSDEELRKVCEEIVAANGEGVCFIIDGLDEYHPQNRDDYLIYKLLDKTFLSLAMTIVTSRPVSIKDLREEAVTHKVEVLGFSKDQILEYVDNFPFTSSLCDSGIATSYPAKLKNYLHSHPNVFSMCYLPVHAALICYLFKYKKGNIPNTQTNIYQEFTCCIILRHLRRHDSKAHIHSLKELRGSTKKHFDLICYLAYCMSIDRKQIVSKESMGEELLELFDSNSDEWCLGLVTINHIAELSGITETYSFLHLTLQEFLTAYYLTYIKTIDIISWYDVVSDQTCIFYFGLLSFDHNRDELKWDCLDHFNRRTRIQCALESQQQIVVDAVGARMQGEYDFPFPTSSDLYALSYVIRNTSHPVTHISLTSSDYSNECDYADFLTRISSKHDFSSLEYLDILSRLNNTATLALSRILNSCSSLVVASLSFHEISHDSAMAIANISKHLISLRILNIKFWSTSGGITTLLRGLSNITNLEFHASFNDMDSSGVVEIGNVPQPIIALCSLRMAHCNIDDNAASTLANGIRSNVTISRMWIRYSTISHSGIVTLLNEIHCLTELTDLNLSHNNIGCDGATTLANQLQYLTRLSRLELSNNNIGSKGATVLANQLQYLTQLSELNLSNNNIGCNGATALANQLQYLTRLSELNLSNNNIGCKGATALANQLQYLTRLSELNLSNNNIGCNGATALANQLQYLTQLSRLSLSNNDIGSVGVISLANTFHHLTRLWYLNLSCNSLNLSSAIAVITATKYISSLNHINLSINSSRSYRPGIYVQSIVSPNDEAAYADLLAATQQHKEPLQLHL